MLNACCMLARNLASTRPLGGGPYEGQALCLEPSPQRKGRSPREGDAEQLVPELRAEGGAKEGTLSRGANSKQCDGLKEGKTDLKEVLKVWGTELWS